MLESSGLGEESNSGVVTARQLLVCVQMIYETYLRAYTWFQRCQTVRAWLHAPGYNEATNRQKLKQEKNDNFSISPCACCARWEYMCWLDNLDHVRKRKSIDILGDTTLSSNRDLNLILINWCINYNYVCEWGNKRTIAGRHEISNFHKISNWQCSLLSTLPVAASTLMSITSSTRLCHHHHFPCTWVQTAAGICQGLIFCLLKLWLISMIFVDVSFSHILKVSNISILIPYAANVVF